MITRSLLTFALTVCSTVALLPSVVSAQTPLNRATIQNLRNKVDLLAKQQTRAAQKADIMTPGDALRTYRAAMAELRFNDNSLARLGEQALFQFVPNSRNFDLRQGTVLLFITPGQGRTRVRTPNAAAGIRGSALFVRYIPDSKVTLIGALTNSDIEVSNGDACNSSQTVALKAGQLGYVFNCQIGVYNFDLKKFQETSPLFKEAKLDQNPEVHAEINQALTEQGTFAGNSESNPAWTKLAENRQPPLKPSDLASTPLRPELDATLASQINPINPIVKGTLPSTPAQQPLVTIVRPEPPVATPAASTPAVSAPQINDRPAPPVTAPTIDTPAANVPERPTPPVQVPVTPTTPVTPATPATPAVPATPATPATPPTSGVGAIPATPATPAVPTTPATPAVPATPATPATPPVVSPPTTPTVVTSPPVTTTPPTSTVTTPTVTTPVATTPVVDTPILQPAPAPTPSTTPATPTTTPSATTTTGAGGQTSADTTRPVPIVQPTAQ